MATSVIKQRTIEKFIMSEFVQGNLNTKRTSKLYASSDSKEAEYVCRTGWQLHEKRNRY